MKIPSVGTLALAVSGVAGCARAQQTPADQAVDSLPLMQAGAGFYQEVSWAPDGSAIAVSILEVTDDPEGFRYRVHRLDLDPPMLTALTTGPMDLWTSWAPDGGHIAYAARVGETSDIFTMQPDGTTPLQLTSDPAEDTQPAWSPDGRRIAFVSNRDGMEQVWVMNADGTSQVRVGTAEKGAQSPAWSPDGRRIVYYETDPSGDDQIYVMNADGTGRRHVAAGVWPSWLPDGTRIVFGGSGGLSVVNADGTGESLLLPEVEFGRFSPDGTRIAYTKTADGQVFVGVVNADGSGDRRLLMRQAPNW